MLNIQNEIKYAVALSMLKKLLDSGLLDRKEFDIAHSVVADRFGPEMVRYLPESCATCA